MSLMLALANAKSGLFASEQQTATASANIANASTPGYVRKETALTSLVLGGAGSGVEASQVRSFTDQQLLRDLRFESAGVADFSARASALDRYANVLGEPHEERSIAFQVTNFADGIRELFDNPSSTTAQRGVLTAAQDLAASFGAVENAIRAERETAEGDIANAVVDANEALSKIEDLNERVRQTIAADRDPSDLQDERDRQLDALAEVIGIRSFEREDGETVVMTREGVTLLDGRAREIQFTAVTTIPPAATLGAPLSGLSVDGIDITPGIADPKGVKSGKLAGLFALRDDILPQFQSQVDGFAQGLITTFEAVDATVVPGNPGLFTDAGAALTPPPAPGLAGRIAVNAAVDPDLGGALYRLRDGVAAVAPGAPGDTTQVEAFLDGLNAASAFPPGTGLPTSETIFGYASAMIDAQQTARVDAENKAETRIIVRDALQARHVNQTGVNIDEEAQRLLVVEQAYAANARVISTIQSFFDELNRIR